MDSMAIVTTAGLILALFALWSQDRKQQHRTRRWDQLQEAERILVTLVWQEGIELHPGTGERWKKVKKREEADRHGVRPEGHS